MENLWKIGVIHQNIRSIVNNTDEVQMILNQHRECTSLCVTEYCHTKEQIFVCSIDAFQLVSIFGRKE